MEAINRQPALVPSSSSPAYGGQKTLVWHAGYDVEGWNVGTFLYPFIVKDEGSIIMDFIMTSYIKALITTL
jgi:hypothetical protein